MSVADLMEAMAKAGAPMEAIILAIRALEEKDAVIASRRAVDRDRKRKQRSSVTGQSRDRDVTVPDDKVSRFEVSPQTPLPNPNFQDISPLTPQTGEFSWFDFRIFEIGLAVLVAGCEGLVANTVTPEHLLEAYNSVADDCGLSKAKMNPKRRRSALARIRGHSVDDITEAIACLRRNSWMHGDNDRGWRADFDFVLQPKSFTRLVEGSYDRSQQAN